MLKALGAVTPAQRAVRVYGVRINSDWDLGAAPVAPGTHDIRIRQVSADSIPRLEHLPKLRPYDTSPLAYTPLRDGGALVSWDQVFKFVVSSDGSDILGHAETVLAPNALRAHLLGPVVSFALLRLGQEPLHSTALTIDGAAFALLGDSGVGKSTLAAAFLRSGAKMLTDDLLVVHCEDDMPVAQPGLQRIKLMPDAAARWSDQQTGSLFHPGSPKRVFTLGAGLFSADPAPLRSCFVLERGSDSVACTRLTIREAMRQLAASTFNTLDARPERLRNHLSHSARLAERVPVFRLELPDDLEAIASVVQVVRATLDATLRSNRA
jgi:hypothetical protein